MIFAWSVQRLG